MAPHYRRIQWAPQSLADMTPAELGAARVTILNATALALYAATRHGTNPSISERHDNTQAWCANVETQLAEIETNHERLSVAPFDVDVVSYAFAPSAPILPELSVPTDADVLQSVAFQRHLLEREPDANPTDQTQNGPVNEIVETTNESRSHLVMSGIGAFLAACLASMKGNATINLVIMILLIAPYQLTPRIVFTKIGLLSLLSWSTKWKILSALLSVLYQMI